jgi:hypothetical protein
MPENKDVSPVAGESRGSVRITDPYSVTVTDSTGKATIHERGEIIQVDAKTANELFRAGRAVPVEVGPIGIEKR